MYVRDAKNRDEVWLLDNIEAMGLDDASFRSREYVIAVDEETDERAGFGRLRVHRTDDGERCELTCVGVLEPWRGQGVGAHVVERLVETARDEGFETVYALTGEPGYLAQFGFESAGDLPAVFEERLDEKRETVAPDAVSTRIDVAGFSMPTRLRQRFKRAGPDGSEPGSDSPTDPDAEDFGIDTEEATYKYDTGG